MALMDRVTGAHQCNSAEMNCLVGTDVHTDTVDVVDEMD